MIGDGSRIKAILECWNLNNRKELDHVLECLSCEIGDGYVDFCLEFQKEFRGWVPSESPPSILGAQVLSLWQDEILRQAMPVLRFDQFAVDMEAEKNLGPRDPE